MKKTALNKWLILFIICIGGGIIYIFPYLQYTYYDSMMGALGFSNTQMGTLISVYGMLNLVAYFFGGIVADRFQPKNLLTFSLVGTGLTGFIFATYPSYGVMLLLSVVWSITTTFTYWPAMMKAVKLLGSSEEQGRLFGFREALFSVLALVFSGIGLVVFNRTGENFKMLVITYSIIYCVCGVITFFFLPKATNDGSQELEEKHSPVEGLGYVLKQPNVWLVGLIIFCAYAVGITLGRVTPYLTNVFQMGVSTAAVVSIINEYAIGTIGSAVGGVASDKLRSSTRCLKYCFILMAVLLAAFVLVPGAPQFLMFAIVFGLSTKLMQAATRGIYFVPLDEIKVPDNYVGTAVGVVSVIGFLSDAFLFTIWGKIMDAVPGAAGYKIMFGSLIGFCVVGLVLTVILSKRIKALQGA